MSQYTTKESMIKNVNEMVETANKVLTDDDSLDFQLPITIAISGIELTKKELVAKLGLLRDLLDSADEAIVYAPGNIMLQTHDSAGNRMIKEQQERMTARAKLSAPVAKKA